MIASRAVASTVETAVIVTVHACLTVNRPVVAPTSIQAGLDEVQFVTHRQTATGNTVMNERTDRFRVGDKWMDLPVAGIFEVGDDGLIVLWRDYFDLETMNRQLAEVMS